MPTYQYACTACGHHLEAVQSFTDEPLAQCPECEGRLRKLFGSVGIVFKGSGFYRTDSRADANGNGSRTPANGDGKAKPGDGVKDAAATDGKTSGGAAKDSAGGAARSAAAKGAKDGGSSSGGSASKESGTGSKAASTVGTAS